MLTTLLVYISATLLCAVIYLIISKSRNSHTNVQNLQTGENLNIDLLGNLFWKVFNSSNHAILLLQNYKIVNCNQRALKLFDSDYDYLVGKTPFDLSPEYQPDGERSDIKGKLILEEIFKKGVVNFEWSQKKSNAELFIADISATSFEVNGLYYVAATMRDITLQKKEQQELTEHRSHLEKLVSEKTALLEEKNFRLKKLNQELDATNEELISNNEELVCTNEQLEKEIQEHLKTQEQKAIAEEKIKQFILQSGNGIIIINSQGVIEEWNEAMTDISGIDKAQAVNNFIWNINAQWSPSIDKESEIERFRKITMDFFDNIKKENGHFYSFETKIIHAALGEKYLQIFMYPIVANRESYAGCIINDITLKKTTETELDKYKTDLEILLAKNSERLMQLSGRFNEVYAVSSDAITFVDIEEDGALKVFDMNPTAQKVFQINCDDIKKGLPVENLLPPEKIKPFIEKIRPSLLKGETITISEDTNIGNGYWKTTIYPITGADGTITRVAAISKDITAERQNEKTTALLNIAFENWPYELWVTDSQGKCILQNEASTLLWGSLIGKTLETLNIPEDIKKIAISNSSAALSGKPVTSEFTFDTSVGKRNVLFNLHPIKIENKVNGYLGIGFDITERKQWEDKIKTSEEKYRFLAENIDDVIWKMDIETLKYTYISPSIYKLTGYTVEESLELSLEKMLMPDSLKLALEILKEHLYEFNNGDPDAITKSYEFQLLCKNGKPVWIEMNTTFIPDSSGQAKEIVATSRKIEKRKAAEAALRESEKRFFDAIDFQPVPIGISLGSKIMLFNKSFIATYGYTVEDTPTVEEWIGNVIQEPLELEKTKKYWKLLQENRFTSKIREHHIRCKDGSIKCVELTESKVGEMLISVFNDITERKTAEDALLESESRYSLITKLSGYVVFDYNSVKKKIKWAGAIEKVTGYTENEMNAISVDKLTEFVHPDDRYIDDMNFENLLQDFSQKKQFRFLSKKKGYIWIETQTFIFFDDKKPSRWLGIMRDITEQRKTQDQILKSEDKFRTIFNASKDGIILLDEDLKILDVNKSLVIKTAYTRQNYIGANSLDFLTTKTAEDTIKWLANLKRSQSVENLETELKNSTNTFVPVEISASKITLNNKNALLLIIRDISERKKLESKLLKSVINTEERERLRFSQELHDELGPLLSAAKMYVDWLDKPNANISKEELIPDIKTLLEEASQSIRNISFKLSPHILQNYGILEALKAFIGKIKEVTKLEINITAPEIPRFAEISETVVYRVLCECINNTIKHAKAKSVNIIFAKSSDQLAVNYSDDGIGFDLEKVMSKPKGIGLLNMQSRLKSINGELHIDASPGHGTNIFLKINTD